VKNKRAHTVPLTDLAGWQFPRPRAHPWVFGGTDAEGFNGYHWGEGLLAQRVLLEPRFVLHDSRRTMASEMARLGVRLEVIEKCLNHQGGTFGGSLASISAIPSRLRSARRSSYGPPEITRIVGTCPMRLPPPPDPAKVARDSKTAEMLVQFVATRQAQNPET